MMKNLAMACLGLLATAAAGQAPACGPHGSPETVLISTQALAAQLREPNLVVLVVGDRGVYRGGHIPGALWVDIQSLLAPDSRLSVELPTAEQLAHTLTGLGITRQSRIVLYPSGGDDTRVSRVYWTLDAAGLGANTSILDGGKARWQQEGRPLEKGERRAPPRPAFAPCLQRDLFADAAYVKAHLHQPGVVIVDAREAEDYNGDMEMMGRRGHIPGAVNIPEPDIIAEGRYQPVATLRRMFAAAGIKPGDTVVSYCHIGLMATEVYVAARLLGYDAKMYDGSFQDWAAHIDFPVEASPGHGGN